MPKCARNHDEMGTSSNKKVIARNLRKKFLRSGTGPEKTSPETFRYPPWSDQLVNHDLLSAARRRPIPATLHLVEQYLAIRPGPARDGSPTPHVQHRAGPRCALRHAARWAFADMVRH